MLRMYSLFDVKAREFGRQVMVARNDADMTRELLGLKGSETTPGRYPEDFALYALCDYDQRTGEVAPLNPPVRVVGLEELFNGR